MSMTAALAEAPALDHPDVLWGHCRNVLGIARLLVQERRSARLVASACYLAVDAACRAALAHAGLPQDGDVEEALSRLDAPPELCGTQVLGGADHLALAERQVEWLAAVLRAGAPHRSWSV